MSIPVTLIRLLFFVTGEKYKKNDGPEIIRGEQSLDDLISSHLAGDISLAVNPLGRHGETGLHVVNFSLTDNMQHPFSKAKTFVEALDTHSIPAYVEVSEEGKGHYKVWIFHESPVSAKPFSDALVKLGQEELDIDLPVFPSGDRDDNFITLPLQSELILLQRCVFVNAVGKMIKDQRNFLHSIKKTPINLSNSFLSAFGEKPQTIQASAKKRASKSHPEQIAMEILFHEDRPQASEEGLVSLSVPVTETEPLPGTPETVEVIDTFQQIYEDSHVREDRDLYVNTSLDETLVLFETDSPGREYLTFSLGKQRFGFESKYVEAVLTGDVLTGLPDSKRFVAGMAPYENSIYPVIEPSQLLHTGSNDHYGHKKIVLLSAGNGLNGLLVDKVGVMQFVPDDQLLRIEADTVDQLTGMSDRVILKENSILTCLDAKRFLASVPWTMQDKEGDDTPEISESILVSFKTRGLSFCVDGSMVQEILSFAAGDKAEKGRHIPAKVMYNGHSLPVVRFASTLNQLSETIMHTSYEVLRNERIMVIAAGGVLYGLEVDKIEGISKKSVYKIDFPAALLTEVYHSSGLIRLQDEDNFRFLLDPATLLSRIDYSAMSA